MARLWIVHDNCDFTERSLVYSVFYNCSHLMHTSANISTHNFIYLIMSKNFCLKMLSAFIVCCIYSHAQQTAFDHMEANIDLLRVTLRSYNTFQNLIS